MARLRNVPLSGVADVVGGAREAERRRRACVRVAVELDAGAPRDLVLAVKEALVPRSASGLVHVAAIDAAHPLRVNPDADLALVVAGDCGGAVPGVARAFRDAGVPCAIVVESALDAPSGEGLEGVAVVAAASSSALMAKLAAWMADSCVSDIALAANFPFCRHAVAAACVSRRSAQNGAVALLPLGSGADLPVMAVNEVLMALDLAGAYGHGASAERLAEAGAVIVGAYASRALARRAGASLPGLGVLVRAGVAYAATSAMGRALMARFELEGRLYGRANR